MAEDGTELLEELMRFKPDGLSPNAWAVLAGVGRTIWSDLRRHGNPSRRTLSKLLEAAGSSLAEFEALRVGGASNLLEPAAMLAEPSRGWGQTRLAPLPLLSTQAGGAWSNAAQTADLIVIDRGKVMDGLPRPQSLAADPNAYALTVVGESMWPRFRQGRRLAVSPAAPVQAGDDVLVFIGEGGGALIGELRSKSGNALVIRHFNPSTEFELAASEVGAVHKVVGELI